MQLCVQGISCWESDALKAKGWLAWGLEGGGEQWVIPFQGLIDSMSCVATGQDCTIKKSGLTVEIFSKEGHLLFLGGYWWTHLRRN